MNKYAELELKKVTNKNSKVAFKAINKLMHFRQDRLEIIDKLNKKKAVDDQRAFQLFVAKELLAGRLGDLGKQWNRFEDAGWLKKGFLDIAIQTGEFYWPAIYHVLSDSLASNDILMNTENGIRRLKHAVIPTIIWRLEKEGMVIAHYFQENINRFLPEILEKGEDYLDKAIILSGYFFKRDDIKIIEILEGYLKAAGRSSTVKIEVYNNEKSRQDAFIADNDYLKPDEIVYVDKDFSNYRSEKMTGTVDLGRVIFTPTGLLDKCEIEEPLERIRNNG